MMDDEDIDFEVDLSSSIQLKKKNSKVPAFDKRRQSLRRRSTITNNSDDIYFNNDENREFAQNEETIK
jgi:hypothetical protein